MKDIEPVVRKIKMLEHDDDKDDLRYWLSKTPGERLEAMGIIAEQYYAMLGFKETPRIEHVVIKRKAH